GAVRGVLQPLLAEQVEHIHIVNRTVEKAIVLSEVFEQFGSLSAGSYQDLSQAGSYDVIINATASSLSGDLPPLVDSILGDGVHAYDMMYAAEPTVFERWCTENSVASVSNGLGMLVEQAAESFSIWRGVRPQTDAVLAALTQQLKG
ncbi:UNVERIFIED_CONTAM: hypothetical protein GTU68_029959, partial [Idotea baltica]|nr:hypothetical protein [Idotea baltica]